jgi:DNA-binding transcriptional ArsR family regulator
VTALPDDRARTKRPATEEEARALASAVRLRILRLTLDRSLTNKEIAERLGHNPASTLHHVRRLVDTGFLVAEPPRRGRRGSREVPYRATGKSWTLDVSDVATGADHQAMIRAFLEEIGEADMREAQVTRLAVRLDDDELAEFLARVHAVLEEYAERPRPEHLPPYGVFFTVYPDRR